MRFFITLLTLLLSSCSALSQRDIPTSLPHKPIPVLKEAPLFTLKDLRGVEVSLKELKGRIVILHFWALWCGQCVQELPAFEALYEDFMNQGVTFLAISEDTEEEKLLNFFRKHNYMFRVLQDSQGSVRQLYGVSTLPSTVVIDSQGMLRAVVDSQSGEFVEVATGPKAWNSKLLREYFDRLVAERES